MQLSAITRGAVVRASPDATVMDVCKLMEQQNVGCVVIAEGEIVVGIVTDRDIMLRIVLAGKDPVSTPISEGMSRDPVVFSDSMGTTDALRVWKDYTFRRAPLVDAEGHLSGIVSLDDLVQLASEEMNAIAAVIRNQTESVETASRQRSTASSREAEVS